MISEKFKSGKLEGLTDERSIEKIEIYKDSNYCDGNCNRCSNYLC